MNYNELTTEDKEFIAKSYKEADYKQRIQLKLAEIYNVTDRTIRQWCFNMGIGQLAKNKVSIDKILIYDIETGRVPALVWWSGKQFVSGAQLTEYPKIITIAYKWLGSDEVKYLKWDENHDDKEMMQEFVKIYNDADMIVGWNSDKFDNRWINARALKHDLSINTYIRSFDGMKEAKRLFRLPSYALDYVAKFLGIVGKMEHEGLKMWDKIQNGTPEEQKEYLQKMIDYNVQDIITTEHVYVKLRKYMGHKTHFGVLNHKPKWTCPNCGSEHVEHYKTTSTPAGTIQIIMECQDDKVKYKITNKQYMLFIDNDREEI